MIFRSHHSLPIPTIDILSWVFENAHTAPDRPIFLDAERPDQQKFTASELLSGVKRVRTSLLDSRFVGIKQGDVVLGFGSNCYFYPVLLYGIIAAGGVFSGINYQYGKMEFLHQLRSSKAKALFVQPDKYSSVLEWLTGETFPKHRVFLLSMTREDPRTLSLGDMMLSPESDWERLTTHEQVRRPAFLMYSSGTTGKSKGCYISHFNTIANCAQVLHVHMNSKKRLKQRGEEWAPYEITAQLYPYYASAGIQLHIIIHTRQLNTGYVLRQFSLPLYLSVIEKHKVDNLLIVPPVAVQLAKNPIVQTYDLSSLRAVYCGAAPLGRDLHLQVEHVLSSIAGRHVRLRQGYGLTEIVLAATWFGLDENDGKHALTSVGRLIPNVQAKLIDESGKEVGVGERGEILLKGPNVFDGYLDNPEADKNAFLDGWFRTGDIGLFDQKGLLYIVDRVKELIKVKGFQVAPAELEDLLLKNPEVADAAVIGIPTEGTELVRAYIVPASKNVTAESIETYVSSQVARYKWLTGGVVFVESIPKSPSGKILRRQLREMLKEEQSVKREPVVPYREERVMARL